MAQSKRRESVRPPSVPFYEPALDDVDSCVTVHAWVKTCARKVVCMGFWTHARAAACQSVPVRLTLCLRMHKPILGQARRWAQVCARLVSALRSLLAVGCPCVHSARLLRRL
eukprot:6208432-Pleurochrysis_carterae.AAC.1